MKEVILMKKDITWKPRKNTGKTRFNREKKSGESWTAKRTGTWGAEYVCKENGLNDPSLVTHLGGYQFCV